MAPISLSGQSPQPHRCRRRRCLLKGCGQRFQPSHPQCRYCSNACREAARRWRRWHAQQKYRSSPKGREHRQQQARCYRQRHRNRRPSIAAPSPVGNAAAASHGKQRPREGKRPAPKKEEVRLCPCDRPGCYVLFAAGSPGRTRRFCCALCRQALRCVLQREARWRQRRRRGLQHTGRRPRARPRGP